MLDREGFRPNVGIVLLNARNHVFWGKRLRTHSWQFPQGGIKHGESPEQAMFRELQEEVGLLADHVQIGFAYRMHLDGGWQKVRLSHVSAARSFFIFSMGGRHKQTISLTRRMLERLCETGRLKAFETSYLVERATARARRQLAGLSA